MATACSWCCCPTSRTPGWRRSWPGCGGTSPAACYLSLNIRRRPGDAVRLHLLSEMAGAAGVPTVVTGDVLYHAPERRILQDVVTCIREGCTIDAAGFRRERHADRHMKAPAEMARLYARHPEALARTLEIVDRCAFSLSELRYQYPDETERPGETRAGGAGAAGARGRAVALPRRPAARRGARSLPTSCG